GGGEATDALLLVLEDVTAVKEAEVRMRVLADSGRTLVESLEYEQRLVNVAHMALPALADWCAVYLTDEALSLRRVVTVHRSPAGEPPWRSRTPVCTDRSPTLRRPWRGASCPRPSCQRFPAGRSLLSTGRSSRSSGSSSVAIFWTSSRWARTGLR